MYITDVKTWTTNVKQLNNSHNKTNGTKKRIIDHLCKIYTMHGINELSDIIVFRGRHVNPELMDIIGKSKLIKPSNLNFQVQIGPYDFNSSSSGKAYFNFAASHIGGGILSPEAGYVQEEKITLQSSILLSMIGCNNYLPLENTNLYDIPLVMKNVIIMAHENYPVEFYGRFGLEKFKNNEELIAKNYVLHKSHPSIIWVCKAIQPMKNSDTYKTKIHNGIPICRWALLMAIETNLTTIKIMEDDPTIKTIYINGGNWGCGAFGHNLNTIYAIEHMAMIIAVNIIKPIKNVIFTYHTYDNQTFDKLNPSINFVTQFIHQNLEVDIVMGVINSFHSENNKIWCEKL